MIENKHQMVVTVLPKYVTNDKSMKRHLAEDPTIDKRLKKNEKTESSIFNNRPNNNCLFYINNDNVYKKAESTLFDFKPLKTIRCEKKSSSTSSVSHQFSSLNHNYVNPLPHTLSSTLNSSIIQPIKPLISYSNSGQKYMDVEKPSLEPIRIKVNRDNEIFEGIFLFIFS